MNIQPTNDKDYAHGYWECYRYNGNLWYKSYYINGKESDYKEYLYTDNIVELSFNL